MKSRILIAALIICSSCSARPYDDSSMDLSISIDTKNSTAHIAETNDGKKYETTIYKIDDNGEIIEVIIRGEKHKIYIKID